MSAVWEAVLLLALCVGIFAGVLRLYGFPAEAVGYAGALCGLVLAVWGVVKWIRWRRKNQVLEGLRGRAFLALDELPESRGQREALYQALLREMGEERRSADSANDARRRETLDYFTLWVHQIKTPIAAMRLLLRDEERDGDLGAELFRIERYVELALGYLRLDGGSSDYMVREYRLEPVIRQAARKYAPLFIRGRVALEVGDVDMKVLTDEKWLQLVVEQVFSNAVKYAPGGKVAVSREGETLVISDNGVGIAPEDLPRVFDWGFTGCNGRMDKRATGIGLYLCRQICRRLGHTITVDSELGRGTRVRIGLTRPLLEVE